MTINSTLKKAWKKSLDNFKEKRYIQNYPNDILAGNITRTPLYACIDNAIVGVSDTQAIDSVFNSLKVSCMGWSLVYTFGNSVLATGLEEVYQKHAKKIDATYSAITTFGFGMGVNLAAGYNMKQALMASGLRAITAIPLGPFTRYYTDSFRQMRGEPKIAKDTQFKDRTWGYSLPRAVAMIGLPLATMFGTLEVTSPKQDKLENVVQNYNSEQYNINK